MNTNIGNINKNDLVHSNPHIIKNTFTIIGV